MSFQDFWTKYPRKVSKRVAEASWKRMTPQEQSDALEAIDQHIKYWKIKDTATDFIPHPATWLNQGRWEDELDMTIKEQKKPEIPWYATDELTMKKGNEIGLQAHPGEAMGSYRQRIHARLGKAVNA